MDFSQATGRQPVWGPFTSRGQSEGISDRWNVPWKDNKRHVQTYREQTSFSDESGVSFHYWGRDSAHGLGRPPTLFLTTLAMSWNMSMASASYLHCFTAICAAELLGSSVGSGEDALHKHGSTLGWMVGSWQETEIGAKLPEGHNANQPFLFRAAGRTKGARSTGSLVVKIALQG